MERSEIDKLAYKGKELPENSNIFDEIYWLGMYWLYKVAKLENITNEQAASSKAELTDKLDKYIRQSRPDENLEKLFKDSLIVFANLGVLTGEDLSELTKKSKAELIEIIIRFEATLNGTLKRYNDNIPEIYGNIMAKVRELTSGNE